MAETLTASQLAEIRGNNGAEAPSSDAPDVVVDQETADGGLTEDQWAKLGEVWKEAGETSTPPEDGYLHPAPETVDFEPEATPEAETPERSEPSESTPEEPPETEGEPEIDYDMKVPLSDDGDVTTLGAMKDEVQEYRRRKTTLSTQEKELMRDRSTLLALQENGGRLDEGQLQELQAVEGRRRERENKLLASFHPEWQSDEDWAQARSRVETMAKAYGFEAKEFTRAVEFEMFHRLAVLEEREADAKKAFKTVKKEHKGRPKGRRPDSGNEASLDSIVDAAAKSRSWEKKEAAVNRLLGIK